MAEEGPSQELKEEIKKWTEKLENELPEAKANNEKGVEYLTNIKAYREDSLHFLQDDDYVRAFEAVLWAWAYLRISKDLDLISGRPES